MTLNEGQRVKLAADLTLTGSLTAAGDAVAGLLALASGTEGTVERVDVHRPQSGEDVREYERLKSLLDSFGHQMPEGSRKQLQEKVAALEPVWTAFQEQQPHVTVRVRLDNGFVLDGTDEELFASS
ncbi:hypothetical protein Snoj_20380 [Streptomyces nojiriensis]|uniref:Uncharacterized protein n=1 Tax=Streptomyces nojiriensis TaxID=66374 RepID=A0ABQ3SIZ5_9ACTN|nr:hypothetical protein [Streptomyces nojiriensis]QTI49727.1 hypothetical protein JYK04_07600 [Streptomyces nojiriensis]GGS19820.1 hypothetical protein GCM10010205_57160 [Streptomyces nojiriensis]GHI68120.1 hypothetical protein Snoj_20380 [Streptomyces nojiriensis]